MSSHQIRHKFFSMKALLFLLHHTAEVVYLSEMNGLQSKWGSGMLCPPPPRESHLRCSSFMMCCTSAGNGNVAWFDSSGQNVPMKKRHTKHVCFSKPVYDYTWNTYVQLPELRLKTMKTVRSWSRRTIVLLYLVLFLHLWGAFKEKCWILWYSRKYWNINLRPSNIKSGSIIFFYEWCLGQFEFKVFKLMLSSLFHSDL